MSASQDTYRPVPALAHRTGRLIAAEYQRRPLKGRYSKAAYAAGVIEANTERLQRLGVAPARVDAEIAQLKAVFWPLDGGADEKARVIATEPSGLIGAKVLVQLHGAVEPQGAQPNFGGERKRLVGGRGAVQPCATRWPLSSFLRWAWSPSLLCIRLWRGTRLRGLRPR